MENGPCTKCSEVTYLLGGECVFNCGHLPGYAASVTDGLRKCITVSVLPQFGNKEQGLLSGADIRQLANSTLEDCAFACVIIGHECMSFEHSAGLAECHLNYRAASSSHPVTPSEGWQYFPRLMFDNGAFLHDGAYIEFGFNSLLGRVNNVSISFISSSADGVLWRQGQRPELAVTGDFMGVSLQNGAAVLGVDLGDGAYSISAGENLADNQWHVVHVTQKDGRQLTIAVRKT